MDEFIIRQATIKDVPFLVDTIIEAEKSGTDILSYSTVFGLSEEEVKKYITAMLNEEIDGCELSISSFIIAEKNGQTAAAVAAWIEGMEGIPSLILKGNLLNYILPKECSARAIMNNIILQDLHIEYIPGTMALGLVYVAPAFRGLNLSNILIDKRISQLLQINPLVKEMYVQVFGNNLRAIKAYEKANFKVVMVKESIKIEILNYLPSNKKLLMKKELAEKFEQYYSNNKLFIINVLLFIASVFDDGLIAFSLV
jgi:ribosomal protein S18 acetylase RimI-like enzyme